MVTKPSTDDVRAIIETSATDAQVQAAIDDAALIVEDCVEDLPADRQAAIIKYVAAHLLATNSSLTSGGAGAVTSSRLGDASESYATAPLGTGLQGTEYGKRALMFDPNGCIAQIGRVPVVFEVL